MPWKTIDEVPANIKKHKGADLSLEQANKWGEIYDSLKANSSVSDPAAAAWSTWEEIYELKDGAWMARKREAAESMIWVEDFSESIDIIEKDREGLPSKIRVLVIAEGEAKTKGRVYPRQSLEALAKSGMLDNLKMYDQHVEGSESVKNAIYKARTMREYLSYILPGTSQFAENIKTRSGEMVSGITAVVKLIDRDFKYKVAEAAETMGLSLTGLLDAMRVAGKDVVQSVRKVVSVDWLTGEPNCGGQVLEFVEAAEPGGGDDKKSGKEVTEQMEWKDITAEELKKNRPDLVTALTSDSEKKAADAETKAADAETKATDAETKAAEANTAKEEAVAEAAKYKKELDDKTKEFAESAGTVEKAAMTVKVIEAVESKCAGLSVLGKAQVMQEVLGKTFTTEKEVAEAVDAAVAKQPQPGAKGNDPSTAGGDDKPALPDGSMAFAEEIGMSESEIKRLAEVR